MASALKAHANVIVITGELEMAICPKCSSFVKAGLDTCPKCGTKVGGKPKAAGLDSGGLIGDSVLTRKRPAQPSALIGVGPTTYGDQVSFVGGADAIQQVKNINVKELSEDQFASITNQLNTILTQMNIPTAIDKDTKLKLTKADRAMADLIGDKLHESKSRYSKYVGNTEVFLRMGNAIFLTKRGRDQAQAAGEMLPFEPKEYTYEQALFYYDGAVELRPDYEEGWNNRGNVLDALGKFEDALKCYDRAIDIRPYGEEAWNNKGNALDELGRYEEAIKCYDKVIELKPDYEEAHNNKGFALGCLGKFEEAIE